MSAKQPRYPSPPAIRQRAKELRWVMTPAEQALWLRLQNKQFYGLKFRRQHPLHHFILDFYCHAHQLVIEVDGGVHNDQQDYDQARTEWLIDRDFTVLRFRNEQVLNKIGEVLAQIAIVCGIEVG
ncbi:MAG: DUF559 domain-containing protein [Chloroflexota bacterium]